MLLQQVTSSMGRQGGNMEILRKRHIKASRGKSFTENCKVKKVNVWLWNVQKSMSQPELIYLCVMCIYSLVFCLYLMASCVFSSITANGLLINGNNTCVWNHTLLQGDTFLSFGTNKGCERVQSTFLLTLLTKLGSKEVQQSLLRPPTSQANNIFIACRNLCLWIYLRRAKFNR